LLVSRKILNAKEFCKKSDKGSENVTGVSKLDYVMKALDILGTEMASYLQIDTTTVSKWRNNQRRIPFKNGQARQAAEFILRREKEKGSKVVRGILKTLKEDVNPESDAQQIEVLSLWLTEKTLAPPDASGIRLQLYSPQNGYNTSISIFLDEAGIDEAITHFMEYVLRLPPGQTVYLADYSGINWTSGDEITDKQVRIDMCMRYFRAFSNYGHKLVIIDCDTDIYRPYRAIFRWMELYLLDGVEVWNYPFAHDSAYHYTNFVVEGETVLQCVSNDFGRKPHGMFYTNKETVEFFANNVLSILRKSKQLIESVPARDILSAVNIAQKNLKQRRHIYILNPSAALQIIDVNLLKELLEASGADEEKAAECLLAAKKIHRLQSINDYTYICNLDAFEKFAQAEYIEDANLSEICGTRVIISKAYQRKIVDAVIKSQAYRNNRVIFTSFGYFSAIPENLSILVQEDALVSVWDVKKYQKRLYCLNLDVISGFYRYIDDLKAVIPKVCLDKFWCDKQLRRIQDSLMS